MRLDVQLDCVLRRHKEKISDAGIEVGNSLEPGLGFLQHSDGLVVTPVEGQP